MTIKLEAGKYYRTRCGSKVFIVGRSPFPNTEFPWAGVVEHSEFSGWKEDGAFTNNTNQYDIVAEWREPAKVDGWVNVYEDGTAGFVYQTREEALKGCRKSPFTNRCIATVRVTGVEEICARACGILGA